uniref:GIY-YIG domain-containing protein n=1 Tax=viral metagenome TaxID=1070528 RepID=A0A6C0J801_9ZZZZ
MTGVYVILLNNNRRYAGMSYNVEKRVQEHLNCTNSQFTKLH